MMHLETALIRAAHAQLDAIRDDRRPMQYRIEWQGGHGRWVGEEVRAALETFVRQACAAIGDGHMWVGSREQPEEVPA
jgi:hypothetical protein